MNIARGAGLPKSEIARRIEDRKRWVDAIRRVGADKGYSAERVDAVIQPELIAISELQEALR